MIKYVLAAQALRAFSTNSGTRSLYRAIGNKVGGRSRKRGLPAHHLDRANGNLSRLEEAGAIRDGMTAMEIGTGWAHWEALFMRSFYDVSITLMDVWDNRQFGGFVTYAGELKGRLNELGRPATHVDRARKILSQVTACENFEQAYRLLGFRYVLGDVSTIVEENSLDLIFSSDVLEHVPHGLASEIAAQHYRFLKPGGVNFHQVVPADHLCIYDRSVHSKNYLRYPSWIWKLFFENQVQYINRIQMSDWHRIFEEKGFNVACVQVQKADISQLKPAREFAGMSPMDLETTVFHLIARKPLMDAASASQQLA